MNAMLLLGWLYCIPAALVAWICFKFVAPALVHLPDLKLIHSLFVSIAIVDCLPEPLEQLSYVLLLVGFVATYLSCSLAFRNLPISKKFEFSKVCLITVLAFQLALLGWFFINWHDQNARVRPYFDKWEMGWALSIILNTGVIIRYWRVKLQPFFLPWMAYLIAILYTVIRLLPSFYTDHNIDMAYGNIQYHLPFTLGEFAAVLNGRTPLVDFFSQYQNLMPYFMMPVFSVLGLSITSFTLVMCLLTVVLMTFTFWMFLSITRNAWAALALYIPWVALSFFTIAEGRSGGSYNPFNYYAVGPLRYFGPWCVLALGFWYFSCRSRFRLLLAFFVSALCAINNLDFGLTASFAIFLGVALSPPAKLNSIALGDFSLRSYLKRLSSVFGHFIASWLVAISLFLALTFARSGCLPDIAKLLFIQKSFMVYGFSMLPLPPRGLYWIVLSTFAGSIALMLSRLGRMAEDEGQKAMRTGLLGTSGFFGLGALSYYIGRSHYEVLPAVFCAWGFCLMLLIWEQSIYIRKWWISRSRIHAAICVVPSLLLGFLYLAACSQIFLIPDPVFQVIRIFNHSTSTHIDRSNALTQLVQAHSHSHEKVMIIYPYAHQLANRASVDNIFPFSHSGSLILLEQVRETFSRIETFHVCRVFGSLPVEITSELPHHGFSKSAINGDFAVWSRDCKTAG